MDAFKLQLSGFRLTTVEITYRLPDHPHLLQSYIWQEYDQAPNFPVLKRFLDFWQKNLEGSLYSVKFAHSNLLKAADIDLKNYSWQLH